MVWRPGGRARCCTGEGWLYLATAVDPATWMVTGWQLADHMRTSLVTSALDMAVNRGHAQPGAIFSAPREQLRRSAMAGSLIWVSPLAVPCCRSCRRPDGPR